MIRIFWHNTVTNSYLKRAVTIFFSNDIPKSESYVNDNTNAENMRQPSEEILFGSGPLFSVKSTQ